MTALKLFFGTPLLPALGAAGVIGVLLLIFGVLAPAWLPIDRRHLVWLGGVLIAGSVYTSWVFHQGEEHGIQKVAALDAAALERVKRALERVESCNGGVDWDVTTGKCNAPAR